MTAQAVAASGAKSERTVYILHMKNTMQFGKPPAVLTDFHRKTTQGNSACKGHRQIMVKGQ